MENMSSMVSLLVNVFLLSLFALVPTCSGLLLPDVVSSHMVLQSSPFLPRVWGTALPNTVVTAVLNSGSSWQATTDATGNWTIQLSAQPISWNNVLVIYATESGVQTTYTLTDISFGEVYFCAGQSNMQLSIAGAYNATQEIADAANYPSIRFYSVAEAESPFPLYNTTSKDPNITGWAVAAPERMNANDPWSYFSATCWFFGKNLAKQLGPKIPLGLIAASWGGTRVEAWSSPDALAACNASTAVDSSYIRRVGRSNFRVSDPNDASHLWNGMVVALLNVRLRGMVWYQGEANSGNPVGYECTFPAMIADWRKKFQLPNAYFFFAQIAPFNGAGGQYAALRQAQLSALTLPNVNYAVLIDTNDPASPQGSIHPRDKQDAGLRLALRAAKDVYGYNVVSEGPRLVGVMPTQLPVPSWLLTYSTSSESAGLNLVGAQECVQCCNQSPFIVVASDGSNSRGAAFVNTDQRAILVVLEAQLPKGVQPVTLEFDWEDAPECVLMNQYGIPAVPISVSLQELQSSISFSSNL